MRSLHNRNKVESIRPSGMRLIHESRSSKETMNVRGVVGGRMRLSTECYVARLASPLTQDRRQTWRGVDRA